MGIIDILNRINELGIAKTLPIHEKLAICEQSLTYYEIRRFITLLYRNSKEKTTKVVLGDLLKVLAVLEIKRQPVPVIKKLKSNSPEIFTGD